jgi:serine/threonine-protein kinase
MELVEGETLAERIKQGPIPLDEVLRLASQIAEALAAAHEKGIVHRDLKPGNVMVKADGSVKVLDFGLAKNVGGDAGAELQAQDSPTLSQLATQQGVILGTAAYMAPEQARAKRIDRRADIWAFGVVLYEMLTGKRLFQGEDLSETMAAVMMKEPDLEPIPTQVRRLVRRCLEKDPHKRLRDMGSVMLLLEDGSSPSLTTQRVPPIDGPSPGLKGVPRWAWAVMGALGLASAVATAYAVRSASSPANAPVSVVAVNLTLDLAPAEMLGTANFYNRPSHTGFAISPDGTTVAYVGSSTNGPIQTSMLYRRRLADPQATAILGTERAEYPFFSPDGQWIGFAAGPKLKKVALSGGPPLDICDLTGRIQGASWGPSGAIVFARQGLWIVSDSGGKPPEVLVEGSPENAQYSPLVLPDGQGVLFTETAGFDWEQAHVDSIDIATRQRKTLLTNAADARYSPTGHLLFMRSGTLLAVPFDGVSRDIAGAPVPLLAGLMHSINAPNGSEETGMGQYAISATGTLLYALGGIYPIPTTTLVQVDRTGSETKLAEIKGALFGLRVSPDGKRLVATKTNEGSRANDIWQYGLPAATPTRLTSTGLAFGPLWAADGQNITFTQGPPAPGIYSVPVGGGAPQPIAVPKEGARPTAASWSRDGKWLAYLQAVNDVVQSSSSRWRTGNRRANLASWRLHPTFNRTPNSLRTAGGSHMPPMNPAPSRSTSTRSQGPGKSTGFHWAGESIPPGHRAGGKSTT